MKYFTILWGMNQDAIIGMGTIIDSHATFADAMNTKGFSRASSE